TGAVALDGTLTVGTQSSTSSCPMLPRGSVYTLVSGASVSGTFSNAPTSGSMIQISSSCDGAADPRGPFPAAVEYSPTAVTVTVLGRTTTVLTAAPAPAVTNQPVTLTATVSQDAGTPSGT